MKRCSRSDMAKEGCNGNFSKDFRVKRSRVTSLESVGRFHSDSGCSPLDRTRILTHMNRHIAYSNIFDNCRWSTYKPPIFQQKCRSRKMDNFKLETTHFTPIRKKKNPDFCYSISHLWKNFTFINFIPPPAKVGQGPWYTATNLNFIFYRYAYPSYVTARYSTDVRQCSSALLLRLLHLWYYWCPAMGGAPATEVFPRCAKQHH